MKRLAKTVVPHIILGLFSAIILLPLLWILRVSLTDKLTAYKIPPEIGTLGLMNYVTIFADYPFVTWFLNSLIVALATTIISLPLATALAYVFARYNLGGAGLAARRAGQPDAAAHHPGAAAVRGVPVRRPDAEPPGPDHRASHHLPAVPGLDAGLVLRGRRGAFGRGGAGRRRHALAGIHQDRCPCRGARVSSPPGCWGSS